MYDQRYCHPFQANTFNVPRSYCSSASDGSDLESPVGGGGSSGSSQQSQDQKFTLQHSQQDSPHIPLRQSRPQESTLSTRGFSLSPEGQLNATLPQQSETPAFSDDNQNRSKTGPFQRFRHDSIQPPIPSGNGGQAQSEFVTLPPLIGSSNRHCPHPNVRSSTSLSLLPPLSNENSSTVTPSALHNQSSYPDAGDYLRRQLKLAPGIPVNLDCLPDPPPGQRPTQSYPVLIKLAIYGSPKKMLTLKGIYEAIEERFEFFKKKKSNVWKDSIRHNLSLNRVFQKRPKLISEPGKGSYWELDISQGEGYKRERKRRKKDPPAQRQAKSRQGQQECETDSQSIGEDEESEISFTSRFGSPAQREGERERVGPHRLAHTAPLNRRSSPYPARQLTMRSRAASPACAPGSGHAYAMDAKTPWVPEHNAGQSQAPQAGGYTQPLFPLSMAMAGQELPQQPPQQPPFRSGLFEHTLAWHTQRRMRQQSLSTPSSINSQFSYTSLMSSMASGHFQLGGPVVPSPLIAGGMRVGREQPGSTTVGSPIVPGGSQYHAFGQGQIDEEPEEFDEDGSAQGRESRRGSRDDRQGSR